MGILLAMQVVLLRLGAGTGLALAAIVSTETPFNPATDCPQTFSVWKKILEDPQKGALRKNWLLKTCSAEPGQKKFFEDSRFQACFENFRLVAETTDRDDGKSRTLQAILDDEAYFDTTRLEMPQVQQVPPVLRDPKVVQVLANPATEKKEVERAVSRILKANPKARVLFYTSRHLTTPDEAKTFGRVLIYLPGDKYDQWFQVGRDAKDATLGPGQALTLVSVQKKSSKGATLGKPVVRFHDYFRTREGGHFVISTRLKKAGLVDNCYNCHKTGVIPLNPDPDFPVEAWTPGMDAKGLVEELNREIRDYGAPEIEAYDTRAKGPPIGQVGLATRTDAFFEKCAGPYSVSKSSYPRLRAAMNCASCHDGVRMGVLNEPLGQKDNSRDLLNTAVVTGRMPPKSHDFSPLERAALSACLREEYYGENGIYERWRLPRGCPDAPERAESRRMSKPESPKRKGIGSEKMGDAPSAR